MNKKLTDMQLGNILGRIARHTTGYHITKDEIISMILDLREHREHRKITEGAIHHLNHLLGTADMRAMEMAERKVKRNLEDARQWVIDLHSGMYVNCVYCGHRYGPKDEVPVAMSEVLKEHIEQCPKHPLSELKRQNEDLQDQIRIQSEVGSQIVGDSHRLLDAIMGEGTEYGDIRGGLVDRIKYLIEKKKECGKCQARVDIASAWLKQVGKEAAKDFERDYE